MDDPTPDDRIAELNRLLLRNRAEADQCEARLDAGVAAALDPLLGWEEALKALPDAIAANVREGRRFDAAEIGLLGRAAIFAFMTVHRIRMAEVMAEHRETMRLLAAEHEEQIRRLRRELDLEDPIDSD